MTAVLVVLPTMGDRLRSFEEALRSVDAQRAEVELRLVVVLPTKARAARSLAAEYGAVLVDDPRRGLAGAMNAGVAARDNEEFYVGLGDDDLLRPGGIPLLVNRFRKTSRAVVAFGACDYIDAESAIIGTNRAGRIASWILPWGPNLVPHPGTLISLDALEKVGGFSEELPYTMDLDAFLKLKKVGAFVTVPQSVSAFRWHADSMTVSGRGPSAKQARQVKQSHLPRAIRPISWLWLAPVAWATVAAGRVVGRRARSIAVAREAGAN